MSEADEDELDLFQQEAAAVPPVTSSGRPRRATRETSRYPREISAKTTPVGAGARSSKKPESSSTRTRAVRQRKPKRKAEEDAHEDESNGVEIVAEMPASGSSPSRATAGKAKAKANSVDGVDLDFLLTSTKSPLVGMEISVSSCPRSC